MNPQTIALQYASGPFQWKAKLSIRDLYNGVKGTYICRENNWQTSDIPPYAQDALHGYTNGPAQYSYDANLGADGGDRRWFDTQLPFTVSSSMAQRLAKIELLRRRHQGAGTFAFNLWGYQMTVLDILQFTLPVLNWNSKLLEISAHRLTLGKQNVGGSEVTLLGTEIDVQETDPSVYEWSVTEELTPQGFQQAALPTVTTPVAPVTPTLTSSIATTAVGADGVARSRILVGWATPEDGYVTNGGHIEVQYQPTGAPGWTGLAKVDPSATQTYIDGVNDGTAYNVQIRSVNAAGVPSGWIPGASSVTAANTHSQIQATSILGLPVGFYSVTWGIGIGTPAVVKTDATPHYLAPSAGTPGSLTIAAKTAPAGAALIVDILKNGVSLLASQLTLAAGATQATSTAFVTGAAIALGDLLTLNVVQVGSTTAGQDITIQMIVNHS